MELDHDRRKRSCPASHHIIFENPDPTENLNLTALWTPQCVDPFTEDAQLAIPHNKQHTTILKIDITLGFSMAATATAHVNSAHLQGVDDWGDAVIDLSSFQLHLPRAAQIGWNFDENRNGVAPLTHWVSPRIHLEIRHRPKCLDVGDQAIDEPTDVEPHPKRDTDRWHTKDNPWPRGTGGPSW